MIAYNRYLYLLRHPRLARRKVSELLGLSDPAENLASDADRLERALRDVNRRLATFNADSPTGRGAVYLDYPKADIRLSARAPQRRNAVAKEPFTVAWLERELHHGDVLFDIGANVGAYALIAARIGGPDVRVLAFEPGAETFGVLCENIVLNRLGERISPFSVVLAQATRLGTFRYRDLHPGAAQHDSTGLADGGRFVYEQPVLQFELDDLVRQFALPLPTLVKLDVDGAESAVLRGAGETIRDPRLRSVMVEMARGDQEVPELLADARFVRVETHETPLVEYGLFARGD